MKKEQIRTLTGYAIFVAIIFILGFTPLGLIMLPIAAITTIHIPVIIGGFIYGVRGAATFGFFFGLVTLIRCFVAPDAVGAIMLGSGSGFGPYNLLLIVLVLFVPRILTGVFSALIYKGLSKIQKFQTLAMGVSAFIGSMTNTVLFLGGLYIFAYDLAAQGFGLVDYSRLSFLKILLGVVALNGVVEAIAAVILCTAVGKSVVMVVRRGKAVSI